MTRPKRRRLGRRYGRLVLGVLAFAVLSAYVTLNLMTEQYEARAALLLTPARDNLDPTPTARNTVSSTGLRREEPVSEIPILASSDLLGQVVDDLGVEAFRAPRNAPATVFGKIRYYGRAAVRAVTAEYREVLIGLNLKKRLGEREQVIAMLLERLAVRAEKASNIITLSLRMPEPELAVRVEKAAIRRYLAKRISLRQNQGVRQFLDHEAGDTREMLAQAEHQRNDWERSDVPGAPDEPKALLLRQITRLSAERASASSDADMLVRQIELTNRLLGELPQQVQASQAETPDLSVQFIKERLARLETDRAHVTTTHQADSLAVNLDAEIARLRQLLQDPTRTQLGAVAVEVDPVRQQLIEELRTNRIRLAGLRASMAAKSVQVARLDLELGMIEEADAHPGGLDRDPKIVEEKYLEIVKGQGDADIDAQLDLNRVSDVSVVVFPTASLEPVSPRKMLVMALSMVVGLTLGIGLALLFEWMSDDVGEDGERLEAVTDIRFLGVMEFGPLGRSQP